MKARFHRSQVQAGTEWHIQAVQMQLCAKAIIAIASLHFLGKEEEKGNEE